MIYLLNNDKSFEGVTSLPLIKIEFLTPQIDFSNIEYILFTSKNSVQAIDKIDKNWINYPAFCIGKATSDEVENFGGKVEFVASKFYGDELAKEIIKKYQNGTFLFPRAENILSNIVTILENSGFRVIEKIVYKTECITQKIELDKKAIIIFTSPSTIKCFLKSYKYSDIYRAIAIGNRTASHFKGKIIVSDEQTIKRCIEIAKNLV